MHDLMCSFWRFRVTIELSIEQQRTDRCEKERTRKKNSHRALDQLYRFISSTNKVNGKKNYKIIIAKTLETYRAEHTRNRGLVWLNAIIKMTTRSIFSLSQCECVCCVRSWSSLCSDLACVSLMAVSLWPLPVISTLRVQHYWIEAELIIFLLWFFFCFSLFS